MPDWRSVRVRMTAAAVAVVGVTMLVAAFALVGVVRHQLLGKLDARNRDNVRFVASKVAAGLPADLPLMLPAPTGGFVIVKDAEGRVVKAAGTAGVDARTIFIEGPAPAPGETAGATIDAGETPFEVRYTQVPTPGGAFTVLAGSPLDSVEGSVNALQRALWFAYPVLLAIVGALAWLLTGRALRPVEAIRSEVEEISAGTLHRRVPDSAGGDEVSRLARTMNHMLDRLEHASDKQKQFVSDASHELRSPVAAIRTHLEVGLAHPEATDWQQVATKALAEEARLESLVSDLLLLASVDEQRAIDGDTDVNLVAVVRDEAARDRAASVTVEIDGPVVVPGRADRLVRAVANLLDNAARYAASGVTVRIGRDGDGRAALTVDDDGPGIPERDRDRVFERFTRLDSSRARNGEGSAGLGLALVKAIVEQHNGTVVVGDAPSGGARFVVSLPAR